MPNRIRTFIKLAVFLAIAGLLAILFVPKMTNHPETTISKQPSSLPPIPPENYIFHNERHLAEIHVPFHLNYGGKIVINALINGEPTKCIVDTGVSSIFWVSDLHFTAQRTGLLATLRDSANKTTPLQEAMLDRVQVGGFELQHMRSYVITSSRYNSGSLPLLGNSVFAHTVLTIDYVKQELIIQPEMRNAVPSEVQGRDYALEFRWIAPDPRGRFGVPCVYGKVMSVHANMAIDTGWIEDFIAITYDFRNRLLPRLQADHVKMHTEISAFTLGKAKAISISRLSWSVGRISGTGPSVAVVSLNDGAQAALGCQFLECFRTTIDYPQQKIWFDPVQVSKVKH